MLCGLCGVCIYIYISISLSLYIFIIINYSKLLPIYFDQQKKGVKHQ